MSDYQFDRHCRTPHSEAYTIRSDRRDIARIDLHYGQNVVYGTLVVLDGRDQDQVAELIEIDQALTSQILRMANSAFYGQRGVSRVTEALVMLGSVVTRGVVLSSTVLDVRQVKVAGFWEHSLGCAVAAGALAKVTGLAKPEEATAAGLLHDLGKVVLYKELPDAFDAVAARAAAERRPFREVERELLGVDHAEIASWLVDRWRFPPCLAVPIVHHHAPAGAPAAGSARTAPCGRCPTPLTIR